MDNFDYRKFVYSQSLTKDEDTKQTLNENAPGYDTRKFGEALPTLESVKAAHEAKENDKKEIKEEEGFVEVSQDEVKMHLKQYRDGMIDGDDLANAIEEIVVGEVSAPGVDKVGGVYGDKTIDEAKQLKEEEEEEELMPKRISDEPFSIVYQTDDMSDYEAYNYLFTDKERGLASGYNTFVMTSDTPADEIEDFLMAEDPEDGNDKLERYGLSKYWRY